MEVNCHRFFLVFNLMAASMFPLYVLRRSSIEDSDTDELSILDCFEPGGKFNAIKFLQ